MSTADSSPDASQVLPAAIYTRGTGTATSAPAVNPNVEAELRRTAQTAWRDLRNAFGPTGEIREHIGHDLVMQRLDAARTIDEKTMVGLTVDRSQKAALQDRFERILLAGGGDVQVRSGNDIIWGLGVEDRARSAADIAAALAAGKPLNVSFRTQARQLESIRMLMTVENSAVDIGGQRFVPDRIARSVIDSFKAAAAGDASGREDIDTYAGYLSQSHNVRARQLIAYLGGEGAGVANPFSRAAESVQRHTTKRRASGRRILNYTAMRRPEIVNRFRHVAMDVPADPSTFSSEYAYSFELSASSMEAVEV